MAYRVVCISAADGARGEDVARAVATALNFRIVDEEIVSNAAREAGIGASEVADVEKRRSAAIRILDSLGSTTSLSTFAMAGYVPAEAAAVGSDLRGLIRAAIEEVANRGEAVIVAHASSMALGERSDVLRVMLTASRDARKDAI